jgi:predicted nuclease with TOPRIM domain
MKPELRERLFRKIDAYSGIDTRKSVGLDEYERELLEVIAVIEADAVAEAKAAIEEMTESLRLRHEQIAALTERVRELEGRDSELREKIEKLCDDVHNGVRRNEDGSYTLVYTARQLAKAREKAAEYVKLFKDAGDDDDGEIAEG